MHGGSENDFIILEIKRQLIDSNVVVTLVSAYRFEVEQKTGKRAAKEDSLN